MPTVLRIHVRRSIFRIVAAATTASFVSLSGCRTATPTAGFSWEDVPFGLPAHVAERLGGQLTADELKRIKTVSLAEVERAFSGFNIAIVDTPVAFWRIEVVRSLPARGPLPNAGESMPLGFMGGSGAVSFDLVAIKAIEYAPAGATRQTMLDGIGRGIGRVAAHEFAHQIVNTSAAHNRDDENSYEYPSPDRAAQYYGDLHWTTARPLLQARLR
jgi:hypothetical protein